MQNQLNQQSDHEQNKISHRATVAVVMMTKNEAHRIAACLDRVKGWADEIIVIDDESTDRTREIAEACGARVFVMPSEDNHGRQWNRGIERATTDWILHIDADEWVTQDLRDAIDEALRDDKGYSAFELMRLNFFLGQPMYHGGWHHRHLILFRRDKTRCEEPSLHANRRIEGRIGYINADIEHYPFNSIEQFLSRHNHYASIEARGLFDREGRLPMRKVVFQAAVRPWKLFWKFYIKKQGRKDGLPGLLFSWLFAFAHFLLWMHYWEIAYGETSKN